MMDNIVGSTLKMEATGSSTVSVPNHQTTQCHNTQDHNLIILGLILWPNINSIY
jgi:hypothetical protein